MNAGQRQIIAEKVSSTIRVLELLGFDYEVTDPRNHREKGNKSPRVVHVKSEGARILRVYNTLGGVTWAADDKDNPIAEIKSNEALYAYLDREYELV
jgi:hypothetical protein